MSVSASFREKSTSAFSARANLRDAYDLVILGSGIACTHSLGAFLANLRRGSQPLRVAVIESSGEFWRGLPYGRRSSPNSLIITTFKEFVPEAEHDAFSAWLSERRRSWTRNLAEKGGEAAATWLSDNKAEIASGDWDSLYIPRQLYGDFAEEKVRAAIARARERDEACVDEIVGEAVEISRDEDAFSITLAHEDGMSSLSAAVVLIATGSPPFRMLPGAASCADSGGMYVNNAYEPGLSENLDALATRLRAEPTPEHRNLLVVGSNATSLELLYMIARDTRLSGLLNRIVVLSTGGALPHRMTGDNRPVYAFPRMQALLEAADLKSAEIIDAVEQDFDQAARGRSNVGDMFHQMSELLVQLLGRLDADAQRDFHHRHGVRFTRVVRRAGAEYRDAAQQLIDQDLLTLVAGSLTSISPSEPRGGIQLDYAAGDTRQRHPLRFAAVFNCAGFEDVSRDSTSRLLSNLVACGLARVNPTGRGLEVGDDLAASPDLFVCGPLLGGVFNDSFRYWHVENVRRIEAVAAKLGLQLAKAVLEKAQSGGDVR